MLEDVFLVLGVGFALFAVLGLLGGALEWWERRYRTVGRHTRSLFWEDDDDA